MVNHKGIDEIEVFEEVDRVSRRYPAKDLKILWGLPAGYCAFPGCRQLCIAEAAQNDQAAIIGKIAHIQAHSDKGPRANPKLSASQRDCYENWILLCGTHHDLVDVQPNTYTVQDLRQWKHEVETWVRERLAQEMPEVTFAELEIVTKAIVQAPSFPSTNFVAPNPREKMNHNNLTERVHFLITLGIGKAREVEEFVEHVALRDSRFPERLKAGFISEYRRLQQEDFEGDSLFEALREFAYGKHRDFQKQAAGLAVLVYLFQKCEVFEA